MKSFYVGKKELARKLNSSPSSVSRWSKDVPDFPKPFLISPNKVVWDLREILRYINKRKEVRGFFGHKPKKDKYCQQNSMASLISFSSHAILLGPNGKGFGMTSSFAHLTTVEGLMLSFLATSFLLR